MAKHSLKTGDYLSANFKPEVVAGALIRDTTAPQDTSVDVTPALTRLKYDLEEIEHQMQEACKRNTDSLLDHAQRVGKTADEVEGINPAVEDMVGTYAKLERDFLKPYQRAVTLHSAGDKLFSAAQLSRNLSWYLQLALQAQSQDYQRESIVAAKEAGDAMLRTVRALVALKKLVDQYPDLLKLRAVQQFESKVPGLTDDVVSRATKMVQEFQGGESDQIKLVAQSLILLGSDLRSIIESHIRALVGVTVSQLSRSSTSPAGHNKAFGDAQDRESVARSLSAISNEYTTKEAPSLDGSKIYWELVASQLDQKLKTMSLANQATLKAFIANKESILSSTQAVKEVHEVFNKYLNK